MPTRPSIHEILAQRFGGDTTHLDLENPFLAQIAARGSCRHFQRRDVDEKLVHTLCAVALSSPTKSDLQQRDFVLVTDPEKRRLITSLFEPGQWFEKAPVLLVVCGNNRRQRQIAAMRQKPFPNDHLDAFFNASVDAGIALSAFVIAAEAVGLGCCPISVLRNYAEEISDILKLPDYVFPVAGIGMGWPQNRPDVSPRLSLTTTVHRNVFNEANIEQQIDEYDRRRAIQQPVKEQRNCEEYGEIENYGWSEDKARQYAIPQRTQFGQFIRNKKFNLE